MKLERIEDFEVWKKAECFSDAVNAILMRPILARNFRLHHQILSASDSIQANMSEGFEQPTDRAFARYLYISKGSTAEVCTRLGKACKRGCLTKAELRDLESRGNEIARMLTGLIKHLMKTPNRKRGLGTPTSD
jgi:four helix bundle protein